MEDAGCQAQWGLLGCAGPFTAWHCSTVDTMTCSFAAYRQCRLGPWSWVRVGREGQGETEDGGTVLSAVWDVRAGQLCPYWWVLQTSYKGVG